MVELLFFSFNEPPETPLPKMADRFPLKCLRCNGDLFDLVVDNLPDLKCLVFLDESFKRAHQAVQTNPSLMVYDDFHGRAYISPDTTLEDVDSRGRG